MSLHSPVKPVGNSLLERLAGPLEQGLSALFYLIFLISPLSFVNTEEKYFFSLSPGKSAITCKTFFFFRKKPESNS